MVADQAAAAGPAFRPAGMGTAAVQSDGAGLSARRTMVAQRDHRRARRGEAERGDRRVLDPADAGCDGAVQFCRDQSRSAAEGVRERRRRISCAAGRIGAATGCVCVGGPRPVTTRRFRRRRNRRDVARQGRVPQRADRADPVRSDHRKGASGADPDRAGLDHEILHSRSVAAEFAGEVSHRRRLHRLHDLVAQSRCRRPRDRLRRLSQARRGSRARYHRRHRAGPADPCAGLLPGRHAAVDRCRHHGARRRRPAEIDHACSPRKPISPRPAN